MSRTRLVILLSPFVVAIAVAAVLGAGALHKATPHGASSPACLPATLEHSAKLRGLGIDVSPAPGTGTANPRAQISFLGAPVAQIHELSVVGQRSGGHSGQLHGYSQGDGASFLPSIPFQAGERVSVQATIGAGHAGKPIAFDFHVDTPYSTAAVPEFPSPPAAPADYRSFETLPGAQAPILSITVPDRDPAAGDILMTNGPGPGSDAALIYTPQGRLVWFHQPSSGISAENLSVQSYRGHRDLTFWQGRVLSLGFGQGEDVVMSSSYQTVARVTGGNGLRADLHDFQIAPHDVAYTTAYNPIHCDLSPAGGTSHGAIMDTAVQAIDMKTGLVRWEWHSLDHIGVSESQTAAPKSSAPWDWFHLNSVDVEGGDSNQSGNLFISARSTWAGYQLQGATGRVLWRLGGTNSSFKMGPGTQTAWQHDGRMLANGEVTFFDNGANPPIHRQSRAVRIGLDFKTHEARLRSAYLHPNPLLSVSQGNVQTLADGSTVVGYGAVPEIGEYSSDGALLFDAHIPFVMNSYRGLRFPWSGRPADPPTVLANLNSTNEQTIVHTSWNGASEVASWRVLAGEQPQSLSVRATIPTNDFESSTTLPDKYAYVAAQALDGAGRVLGVSRRTPVRSYAASFPATAR